MQRVRAAGVGPHIRERYLGRRALLQQQLVLGVEQKHAERAMKPALRLARHKLVRVIFAGGAEHGVPLVHQHTLILVHQVALRPRACRRHHIQYSIPPVLLAQQEVVTDACRLACLHK